MIMADGTDVYGGYNPLAASANSQMLERTRADREGCSFEEVGVDATTGVRGANDRLSAAVTPFGVPN